MMVSKHKEQVLEKNRYKYNFNHMVYFNSKTRKIFSYKAIDDHDANWLTKHIHEKNSEPWQFYCNTPPSDAVKNELINELKARE
jgi:hypothetical protein